MRAGQMALELPAVPKATRRTRRHDSSAVRSAGRVSQRVEVSEIQRQRVLAAAIDTVREVGYADLTVAQVTARARISRKTFYELFSDRDDCFLAAFEQALAEARAALQAAYGQAPRWREGIRAGLTRLLGLIEEEPALAKLCIGEALVASERVRLRRAQVLEELAQVVDRGRTEKTSVRQPPSVTAEGVVGAVLAVLYPRVLAQGDDGPPLSNLLGPLMSIIVLPYLGATAASRELARPVVEPLGLKPSGEVARSRDPLEGLNVRMTYRTIRVLTTIAEHPGISNREVAAAAGIVDQGQISKLLSRLARLALIENHGEGQLSGATNAWRLTPRGAHLEQATRLSRA
jgi:AcrR family transcriptional regulator